MSDFENIIKENHPIIYKICRIYSTDEDFNDLYQEALISIWKSYNSFKGNSKLSTWIYRVVLNTAITYSKKENKFRLFRELLMPKTNQFTFIEHEEDSEIDNLYKSIRKLKKDERSIILLYLEEKKYQEIADIIGISETNVGAKINRIKKKLYKIITSNSHE